MDMLNDSHLSQLILKATRFRIKQHPSLLDLALSSKSDLLTNLGHINPIGKSDHEIIITSL